MSEVRYRSNVTGAEEPPFCMTPTAEQIFHAVSECIRSRHVKLGWIIGPPGIGKTSALREFAEQTPDCVMVTMSPGHITMKTALGYILRNLGYAPPRSTHETYEEVQGLLESRGVRALIVDEAQESFVGLSNALRRISDDIGLAVIFCGNPKFLTNFGKEREAFAQITSRLAVNLRLGKPPITDVSAICDLLGVRDAAARSFLFKCSQSHGALRIVHSLVQKGARLAGSPESIRASHLRDALSTIGGIQ